jgi:zinc/manganese transport system ATP-binding protein
MAGRSTEGALVCAKNYWVSKEPAETITDPVISLSSASVALGGRKIWSEGTFDIPSGQIVAVIGPNGSGKTTLLQLLLGLIPPSAGTVKVFGETPQRGNRRIGYVPQHYSEAVGQAVRCRDLVSLSVTGTRWGLQRSASDSEAVSQALEAVGAAEYADSRMSVLSGGQQQRVAIAQALVGNPELLLLDEPLANLDLRNQREIVDLLAELQRNLDVTILVVVHDMNPLLEHLGGAVYLLDGHAHYGSVGQVVDSDLLSHLYGTQIKVVRTAQGDLYTRSN